MTAVIASKGQNHFIQRRKLLLQRKNVIQAKCRPISLSVECIDLLDVVPWCIISVVLVASMAFSKSDVNSINESRLSTHVSYEATIT
jgi:hypothetical protein